MSYILNVLEIFVIIQRIIYKKSVVAYFSDSSHYCDLICQRRLRKIHNNIYFLIAAPPALRQFR